ncbi:MAG: hypothetical protein LBI18_10760, partial [Planctomycetaceae bacterium]|nr:hypothetical protein [Planctomycetaceae bacterium]
RKCTGGLKNVSDGLSNTFFMSEVVPSKSEQVALGDGSCRYISQTITPLIWHGSSTASDGYGGNF